jgi:hypothetical protein
VRKHREKFRLCENEGTAVLARDGGVVAEFTGCLATLVGDVPTKGDPRQNEEIMHKFPMKTKARYELRQWKAEIQIKLE